MNTYTITKLINNNVVFSNDDLGKEIILFGKAIGFGKKKGDEVKKEEVIKIFSSADKSQKNFLTNLVEDIEPEYIDIASKIIALFEEQLDIKVNDFMLISLSDHVSNAIRNKKEGFDMPLDILQDIKSVYPKEFMIAKKGLNIIYEATMIELVEDEAGYIVLHYLNCQGKNYHSDTKFRLLFQERIINEIEDFFSIKLDRSSLYYTRFLTHLSFLAARLSEKKVSDIDEDNLYEMLIIKYPKLEEAIENITRIINQQFDIQINDEEKTYLAIHINNMIRLAKKGNAQ